MRFMNLKKTVRPNVRLHQLQTFGSPLNSRQRPWSITTALTHPRNRKVKAPTVYYLPGQHITKPLTWPKNLLQTHHVALQLQADMAYMGTQTNLDHARATDPVTQ